jgi:hypothetical protein
MSLSKIAAWTQIACLCTAPAFGQSPQADRIHQQVDRIGSLGTITVKMRDGQEYYGTVAKIDATEFTVNEVDVHREITLRYPDVDKVRSGYGNTRGIAGRRIHPRTRLIVALAVVGGLLALVFIAVAADHS